MSKPEEKQVKKLMSSRPKLLAAAAIVFVLAFAGLGCSSAGGASNARAVADAFKSTSSSAASVAASNIEITQSSPYLEYSNKKTDPAKLVTASDSTAKVSTSDEIDLSKVGDQKVKFKLELEGDSAEQLVDFTIRDTKSPVITFSNSNPSIDQGGSFDPQSCISSVSDPVDGSLQRVDAEPKPNGSKAGYEQFYDSGWYVIDGAVDSSTPGTYSLIVKASDKHGNVASKELLVSVNEVVQETEAAASEPARYTYILNANTGKFHLPGCRDVKKMKDSNKQEITATRQEMLDMGYSPCKHCNP